MISLTHKNVYFFSFSKKQANGHLKQLKQVPRLYIPLHKATESPLVKKIPTQLIEHRGVELLPV